MADVKLQLPNFKGKVIKRGDSDYEAQSYQYASSTYLDKGIINPAAIIKAADDSDVIKAIKYASDNKLAVAVRTGGHQYSGASSTYGNNIQLDLSQTYKDFNWDDSGCTSVTTGVSFALFELNNKLAEKGRFLPHGHCQHVNLGGHVQTGGYGQFARSFGLLADHVKKFRIITADGQTRWVDKKDKDLFFAVLGGSPGNFGVLTHVTFDVLKDEDYPDSRGLRAVYPYDSEHVKKLLDVMVEMAADENFPGDYDYTVTVLDESVFQSNSDNYDEKFDTNETEVIWAPIIVVFAQWANLQKGQTYDPTFFNKIKKAGGHLRFVQVDDDKHIPMSVLSSHWTFPIKREYRLPYTKRVYCSNSSAQKLKDNKWSKWVCDRIESGVPWTLDVHWDLHLSIQIQAYGGVNSRFFQNAKNGTAFSWRDTTIVADMDAFYHSSYDPAKQRNHAIKWQQENDEGVGKPNATFCDHDRRVLWGSHDLDLSANQQYYYDQTEGTYERLCEIKKKYDPSGVFTPNRFCVGLPPVAQPADSAVQAVAQPTSILGEIVSEIEELAPIKFLLEKIHPGFEPPKKEDAIKHRVKPHLNPAQKFQELLDMKREDGKPVPLWDTWRV